MSRLDAGKTQNKVEHADTEDRFDSHRKEAQKDCEANLVRELIPPCARLSVQLPGAVSSPSAWPAWGGHAAVRVCDWLGKPA